MSVNLADRDGISLPHVRGSGCKEMSRLLETTVAKRAAPGIRSPRASRGSA